MEPLLEKNLLSTKVASEISGYSSDYLSRLARAGKIEGVQVGRTWLVHRASLEAFMRTQDIRKEELSRSLAREREREYVQARGYEAPPRKIPSIVPEGASTARIADSVKDPRTAPLNTRAVREILGALARGPMPSIALSFLVVASSASAAALGLPQPQAPAEHDVKGGFHHYALAPLGAQFMAEAGVVQQLPRAQFLLVGHQDTSRQDAERTFQHAHVLVEHQVVNARAVEQRPDGGHQHGIIGADDLAHGIYRRRSSPGARCER